MNWKEFLKLRISKIIIFVFLGIIAYLTEPVQVVCITSPCPTLYPSTLFKVVHLILVFPHLHTLFGLVLNVVYLYLLTSLIWLVGNFVYNKYKKS